MRPASCSPLGLENSQRIPSRDTSRPAAVSNPMGPLTPSSSHQVSTLASSATHSPPCSSPPLSSVFLQRPLSSSGPMDDGELSTFLLAELCAFPCPYLSVLLPCLSCPLSCTTQHSRGLPVLPPLGSRRLPCSPHPPLLGSGRLPSALHIPAAGGFSGGHKAPTPLRPRTLPCGTVATPPCLSCAVTASAASFEHSPRLLACVDIHLSCGLCAPGASALPTPSSETTLGEACGLFP